MNTAIVQPRPATTARPTAAKRFGYVVAIGCNAVVLYIVHHLLDWGWPRFLTDDFEDVLPIMTLSLVVGIVTNGMFLVRDSGWFRSLANAITAGITVAVAIRLYQVFPFDFSTYATDWTWLARALLVLTMLAAGAAAGAEVVQLVRTRHIEAVGPECDD